MQVFENFCARAGLVWGGGVGIGGGVMLNVTRILFVVQVGILLLNIALSLMNGGGVFPEGSLDQFRGERLASAVLQSGRAVLSGRMGHCHPQRNIFREEVHPYHDSVFHLHPVRGYLLCYYLRL